MYRAYIKNLEDLELAYAEIPHKGHFIYGNLIEGGNLNNTDAIVGNLIEVTDEYISPEWWCSIEKGSSERYTGMKDINGKKTYEGDLVKLPTSSNNLVCKVTFKEGKFKLLIGETLWLDLCDVIRDCKIVGNINEDPELLEVQQD